ncbi:hypothetical protein [Xylophilus sp. GOD-11R]|uniref:hypothetical protein n=1 Tax=Xylophilus sp. GOD-11R TaxID=3089814 RepID=UPI00298C80C3|nr:hypothetical protein [Xylophilus sp. GOD-11R]WPB57279.1 hypothetical protein R9X41_01065 [Xylophilus sp. GOD-11R]
MAAREESLNRDPISDEPGAHPIGTGIGAGGGAITGAALGLAGGPVGVAVGTVIGAVVGGLAGKGAAEAVNPTAEDAYWRDAYVGEPYYTDGLGYDDYAPAYRAGYEGWGAGDRKRDFDAYDAELRDTWDSRRGESKLSWDEARPATRAAWERAQRQYPMDI